MNALIKIFINNEWIDPRPYQKEAFLLFKNNNETPLYYNKDGYKFGIKRISKAIYMIREDNTRVPIVDWNDVYVFLLDQNPPNWYSAREYQIHAYFDYLYSNVFEKKYTSKNSDNVDESYTILPFDNIDSNITFKLSRNSNGTIYYEKNDTQLTRIRISDNFQERLEYNRMYDRMTEPLVADFLNSSSSSLADMHSSPILSEQLLIIPDIPDIGNNENIADDDLCVVCNIKKHNIIYRPCNHKYICSICSKELLKYNAVLNCPLCKTKVNKIDILNDIRVITLNPINWFHSAFGFIEKCQTISDYHETFKKMYSLYEIGLKKKINGIDIGDFKLINLLYIKTFLPQINRIGKVKINNIIADVIELHKNQDINNCTIQVASQLNCLEMINSEIIPEHGITIYQNDRTQGPLCVMCTPGGIAYRSYIYGQSYCNQIDMSKNLLKYLKELNPDINWTVINGYLKIDSIMMLQKINKTLGQNSEIKNNARNQILAGMHNDLGVYINNDLYNYCVNHVLCSGLPISYHTGELSKAHIWGLLAEIFLEAYYELTLLIACYNNNRIGTNKKCYLTKIGGGVFGMNNNTIIKAIKRAIEIIKNRGYDLEICLVHYNEIDHQYQVF